MIAASDSGREDRRLWSKRAEVRDPSFDTVSGISFNFEDDMETLRRCVEAKRSIAAATSFLLSSKWLIVISSIRFFLDESSAEDSAPPMRCYGELCYKKKKPLGI